MSEHAETDRTAVAIRATGLKKQFTDGRRRVTAVDGVSLTLTRGTLAVVSGPSGSGKTTLLSILGGLESPDEGEVEVDGDTLAGKSLHERALIRRTKIAFVFQANNLLPMLSVYENVTLALGLAGLPPIELHRRARWALEVVGLNAMMHDQPALISSGERQRAAIARAIAKRPAVMLLDEPTAHVDAERASALLLLLSEVCHDHGPAAIVATHDPQAHAVANLSYTLTDGRLSELSGR